MYDSFVAFIVELAIEFQYLVTPTYYLHVPYANFNLENPCGVVYSDIQLHQTIYDFTNWQIPTKLKVFCYKSL